jgi:hypothetical protein
MVVKQPPSRKWEKGDKMRFFAIAMILTVSFSARAADLESRALTHYVPQDLLENVVRKEGWTEIVLKPYDGVKKNDIARIWTGGVIDHGNSNQPGVHVAGPDGVKVTPAEAAKMAVSGQPDLAYSLLFKTEEGVLYKPIPGKPLEIRLTKAGARLWVAFNDQRGRYTDNHLGKGRRYESDPLWVRVEVIRIIVD